MTTVRRSRRGTEQIVEKSTISVTRTYKKGSNGTTKETVIDVHKFVTEPAYVRVNAGVTKNMGDYESMRLDVSVSMPCYVEEVDRTIPMVSDIVADALEKEIEAYIE